MDTSFAISPLLVLAVLNACCEDLNIAWKTLPKHIDPSWLDDFHCYADLLSAYLQSKTSLGNSKPVDQFLEEHNIPIQLNKSGDPKAIYAASILEVVEKWLAKAQETCIKSQGEYYVGLMFPSGNSSLKMVTFEEFDIAVLHTGSDIVASIFVPDQPPNNEDKLFKLSQKIHTNVILRGNHEKSSYNGLQMPTVNFSQLREEESLEGIIGQNENESFCIGRAKGYCELKINPLGFKAISAMTIEAPRSTTNEIDITNYMVVNKPFVIVISHPSIPCMLMSVVVFPDSWNDPEDLD